MNIAITGANGSAGSILLRHLADQDDIHVVACVRSARAGAALPASPRISPRVIDYDDRKGLASALMGAGCVVHLAGILLESATSSYETANVDATRAVVEACKAAWRSSHRARERARRGPRLGQSLPALEGPGGAHRRRLGSLGRHHSHADPAGPWNGRGPRRRPRSVTADGHASRRRASFNPAPGCGRPEPSHPSMLSSPACRCSRLRTGRARSP